MRKLLVLGFVSAGLLAGCGSSGNFSLEAGMNIGSGQNLETFMGQVNPKGPNGEDYDMWRTGQKGLPYKNGIELTVENIDTVCTGYTNKVDYEVWASGINDRLKAVVPFTCDDGRKGKVQIRLMMGRGASGTGTGKMSDGTPVRFTIGTMQSGKLQW